MRNLQNIQVKIGSSFETVCPFPVGAIYQSTSSTSPASIYGGGWTSLTDGRFLRPQGSWNGLGGENEHQLTIAEMPRHNHEQQVAVKQSGNIYRRCNYTGEGNSVLYDNLVATYDTGNGKAHNNIPAYRTCYCWYRTS